MSVRVRALQARDRAFVEARWRSEWGGLTMVSGGREHHVHTLSGFRADDEESGRALGLLTYRSDEENGAIEVVSLNSLYEGRGVGSALLRQAQTLAAERRHRLFLFMTEDNLPALRFYLRRGFRLVAVHPDAVTRARAQKPSIPEIGIDGQPLRDEWELQWERESDVAEWARP